MYEYMWVYTIAQLEIAACDAPIVVYDDGKKKKERKPKASDLLKKEIEWKEKYANEENKSPKKFDLTNFEIV